MNEDMQVKIIEAFGVQLVERPVKAYIVATRTIISQIYVVDASEATNGKEAVDAVLGSLKKDQTPFVRHDGESMVWIKEVKTEDPLEFIEKNYPEYTRDV